MQERALTAPCAAGHAQHDWFSMHKNGCIIAVLPPNTAHRTNNYRTNNYSKANPCAQLSICNYQMTVMRSSVLHQPVSLPSRDACSEQSQHESTTTNQQANHQHRYHKTPARRPESATLDLGSAQVLLVSQNVHAVLACIQLLVSW
jgi:hypothetical protein